MKVSYVGLVLEGKMRSKYCIK